MKRSIIGTPVLGAAPSMYREKMEEYLSQAR